VKLIPNGLPFEAFARQVEFGQNAFEPVDHFGMALKPCIRATPLKEGFDLVHRTSYYQRSSKCLTIAGLSGFLILNQSRDGPDWSARSVA
jgi:hypothetical protein